jgi:hypothetical protein
MERYLVIWCNDLLEQNEEGREKRAFEQILEEISSLTTHIDVVRPGVCAVPTRGPSRYFGGDPALCLRLAEALETAVPGTFAGIGVADGLFAAVLAARSAAAGSASASLSVSGSAQPESGSGSRSNLVVPPGGTPAFLAPWPVGVLERLDLAELLVRLGIRTLGQFAALPARHVLARFGTDGTACHMAAAGSTGELPGLRSHPGTRSATRESERTGPVIRQPGFWGGTAESDIRAGTAFARIQGDLGPEEVLFGRVQGGRAPSERARLVPFDNDTVGTSRPGEAGPTSHSDAGPWPGRIPAPSPAIVLSDPLPVELQDAAGTPVVVSARVLLSSAPARISTSGGPWTEVTGWAGPWPTDDLWWSPDHRRRARVQVVTASGEAMLLASEAGSWWLEGVYD